MCPAYERAKRENLPNLIKINLSTVSFMKIRAKFKIVFQIIYGAIIRGKWFQLNRVNKSSKKYLNLGCGLNLTSGFINLDYQWIPKIDICWDITKGIPLRSNTMSGIYAEHCLEHITFSQCQKVLNDLYRVLEPGGTLRIVVPDAELYLDLYNREKEGENIKFPYVTADDIEEGFLPIMAINRIFREHGHLYTYDYGLLKTMLEKEGFVNIKKEEFMMGKNKKLLIDSESRKVESLYVEAEKPV